MFDNGSILYLVAHNETYKTKRNSEIYVLDRETFEVEDIKQTPAACSHNIAVFNEQVVYLDSLNGYLMFDNEKAFEKRNYVLRGLSITRESFVVGGSEITPRNLRETADGAIWFLDHNLRQKGEVIFKGIGGITEIRALQRDYAISSQCMKNNSFTAGSQPEVRDTIQTLEANGGQ